MSVPFLGQIQPLAFNFAPRGWAMCDGQVLPIAQNTALFSLLGTAYGGNGQSTFALPDLRSRVPMHFGTSQTGEYFALGETGGIETVTLNLNQLPGHRHALQGTSEDGAATLPADGVTLATAALPGGTPNNFYGPMTTPQPLNAETIGQAGSTEAHNNLQPYLTINWCIAMAGIYPSRN